MENNRDKMVVIMSGYPDEMEVLMKANPGLAGRMPYEIHFPNYSREQLTRIFLNMAGKAFDFDEPFREAAASFFGSVSDAQYKAKNFSNARLARNLYRAGVGQGLRPASTQSWRTHPPAARGSAQCRGG